MAIATPAGPITGGDKALVYAVSDLARSGATRSDYHPPPRKAWLYAQSAVARSGASRSNYHRPTVFISIGGVHYGEGRANRNTRVLLDSLSITDALNEETNTCAMRCKGFVPAIGAEVIVTLGSKNNGRREFAGRISQAVHAYWDNPREDEHSVSAVDYTIGLNARKVSARYTGSASAIAAQLLRDWAPSYSSAGVEPGLPTIDGGITFTHTDLTDAFSQLAKRIGASWYVDYLKVLHFFLVDTSATDPQPLTLMHRTARELAIRRDLSQWITRVLVEGGGGNVQAAIAPGETILPVDTTSWYRATGGQLTAGPQHLTYTGKDAGGAGALVGPGAAPSVPVAAALAQVAGAVNLGRHGYAVSYQTAAGESLVGTVTPIDVGGLPGPTEAVTIGTPQPGAGPNPGFHEWAVTFVTATGETTPGPRAGASTGLMAAPGAAPHIGSPTTGPGPNPGYHEWAVSFVTATGETTAGPRAGATTGTTDPPNRAPTVAAQAGSGIDDGTHDYAVTFVTSIGETTPGPISAPVTTGFVGNAPAPGMVGNGPNATQGDLTIGHLYGYSVAWSIAGSATDHTRETGLVYHGDLQALASTANAAKASHIVLNVPYGPAGVTHVHLYRVDHTATPGNNAPDYRLLQSFTNVVGGGSVQVADGISNAQIAGNAPGHANNTAGVGTVALSSIPTGGAGVTARNLYRRSGGLGLRLLIQLGNNSSTSYTDSTPSSALGAPPPGASTAYAQQTPLTSIPKGAAGVTARRIYRTALGNATLQLVGTLNDNETTTFTDTLNDASLGAASPSTSTATAQQMPLTKLPIGGAFTTARKIYRTPVGGGALQLVATVGDNTTATFTDTVPDSGLGAAPPASSTALAQAVDLTGIPKGSEAVTGRRLYRTAANDAALKLLATIADNVTTAYRDTVPDSALGAAPPASDLSGLKQPEGAVHPGSTKIPVSGSGWAQPAGGWVVIGNGQQAVRYTGVAGNDLVGIPAAGAGAITASISYNSTVTMSPVLLGIPASGPGSVRVPLVKGDAVNLLAVVDDLPGQAQLAALLGGDGVQEDFLQDRRLSEDEARARGVAWLALRGHLDIAVHYTSRDLNSHAGGRLVVTLGPPFNLTTELRIQRSTATFGLPGQYPLYTIDASSQRFSFEDLLRVARLTKGT